MNNSRPVKYESKLHCLYRLVVVRCPLLLFVVECFEDSAFGAGVGVVVKLCVRLCLCVVVCACLRQLDARLLISTRKMQCFWKASTMKKTRPVKYESK